MLTRPMLAVVVICLRNLETVCFTLREAITVRKAFRLLTAFVVASEPVRVHSGEPK